MSASAFAAYHREAVAHYLKTNNLSSLGKINGNILEELTARTYEAFQKQQKQRKARGDATPEEIAIYEAYPRRVARAQAIVAVRAAISKVGVELLAERTSAYGRCVARWPKSYRYKEDGRDTCPYPATWFNRESYLEDEKEWLPAGMFQREDDRLEPKPHATENPPEPPDWRDQFPDFIHRDKAWEKLSPEHQRYICGKMKTL